MFDIQLDRNIQFILGELSAYSDFEKDKDKAAFLSKIFSDLVRNYNAISYPFIKEMIKTEDESEEEIKNED